jgi:hypothetical protein
MSTAYPRPTHSLQRRRSYGWETILYSTYDECVAELERIRLRARRDPGEAAAVDSEYQIIVGR